MPVIEQSEDGTEYTLTMVRGDSGDLVVTIQDGEVDPPVPIDLSKAVDGTSDRPAIIRFAVKSEPDEQDNTEALVFKTSHHADEIPVSSQTGPTLGMLRVLLDKPDTEDGDTETTYRWDLEVTRQDVLRTGASAGTVAITAGSDVLVGTGTAFNKAKEGDVIQLLGVLNTIPVLVEEVLSATQVRVSTASLQTESPVSFEVRRGKHITPLRGDFVLLSGVVAE